MIIVLGMQMADVRDFADIRIALPAIGIRLIIAPLVAIGLTLLFGFEGLTRSVSIIEMATPVAVATIIVTTEFNLLPKAMTTAVVLSTLLSPITLVAFIQLFGL
jgi:predicted permease